MDSEKRPGTMVNVSQGAGATEGTDSDIYAVFESLEQLREAQAPETPPSGAKPADDGSLEATLTHYKDWLRTIA